MGNKYLKRKDADGKMKSVHRIVWEGYYGSIPEGMVIHHLDGNPRNNDILNLQLTTKEEHGSLHGGVKKKPHSKPAWNKLSEKKISNILELHKKGLNYSQIGRELGISDFTASNYIKKLFIGNQGGKNARKYD